MRCQCKQCGALQSAIAAAVQARQTSLRHQIRHLGNNWPQLSPEECERREKQIDDLIEHSSEEAVRDVLRQGMVPSYEANSPDSPTEPIPANHQIKGMSSKT